LQSYIKYKSLIIRVGVPKFHVIFAVGSESSRERKFHLWNFRSREQKYVVTKVPYFSLNSPSVRAMVIVRVSDSARTIASLPMPALGYGGPEPDQIWTGAPSY